MRKIKLYIAASLDGYIARPDDGLDWLMDFPNPTGTDYYYQDFYNNIDIVIMGGRTYRTILNMNNQWIYADRESYVISRDKSIVSTEHTYLMTEHWEKEVLELQNAEGKDIWLMGGGEMIKMFLNRNLLDNMIVTYMPVMIGEGIPLFPTGMKESIWKVVDSSVHQNGVVQIEYERVKG